MPGTVKLHPPRCCKTAMSLVSQKLPPSNDRSSNSIPSCDQATNNFPSEDTAGTAPLTVPSPSLQSPSLTDKVIGLAHFDPFEDLLNKIRDAQPGSLLFSLSSSVQVR